MQSIIVANWFQISVIYYNNINLSSGEIAISIDIKVLIYYLLF